MYGTVNAIQVVGCTVYRMHLLVRFATRAHRIQCKRCDKKLLRSPAGVCGPGKHGKRARAQPSMCALRFRLHTCPKAGRQAVPTYLPTTGKPCAWPHKKHSWL